MISLKAASLIALVSLIPLTRLEAESVKLTCAASERSVKFYQSDNTSGPQLQPLPCGAVLRVVGKGFGVLRVLAADSREGFISFWNAVVVDDPVDDPQVASEPLAPAATEVERLEEPSPQPADVQRTSATVFVPSRSCKQVAVLFRNWDNPETKEWNYLSGRQTEWWIDKGSKELSKVCFTENRADADWLLVWSGKWATVGVEIPIKREITTDEYTTIHGQMTTYTRGRIGYSMVPYSSTSNSDVTARATTTRTTTFVEMQQRETDVLHVYVEAARIVRNGANQEIRPSGVQSYYVLDPAKSHCFLAAFAAGFAGRAASHPGCGYSDEKAFQDVIRRLNDIADAPILGISLDSAASGLLVREVQPGLPGDLAGLRKGDILVRINGKRVKNINDFNKSWKDFTAGSSITVEVKRLEGTAKLSVMP